MSERCFSISNECCIIILSKVNRFEINESIDHFLKMLFTTEKKKENIITLAKFAGVQIIIQRMTTGF